MKKDLTLYNVMFPLWMLLALSPIGWVLTIGGNFIIDSLILLLLMLLFKVAEKKSFFFRNIWKVYGFGLLADCIGGGLLLLLTLTVDGVRMADEWFITIPSLLFSAVLIFLFNYFVTFHKCDKKLRLWCSLTFAVVTAPYTFLVPSSWIYHY